MKAKNSELELKRGLLGLPRAWAILFVLTCGSCIAKENTGFPANSADLFVTTKVWNVYLQFTAEQWNAMEPQDSGGGMPGPGGMRFRGPGGPGGPGGPQGFGPGNFLSPAFMKADQDQDGKVSQNEFRELGQ